MKINLLIYLSLSIAQNPDKHGLVQGSGLGLYIVKQILDKHQFPYGIQNTPQGVKCSIVFPKAM